MQIVRKKVYVFLLIVNIVLSMFTQCFVAWGGATPPPLLDDPNVVTSVTYDTSVTTSTTKYYVGQQVPFYANTQVSSLYASYPGAYTLIYLDKSVFEYPSESDISDYINMPTTGGKTITQQGDYYVIRLNYVNLGGGTTTTVPFKIRLKANGLINGEAYNIPIQLHKNDGTLIETSHNNFLAYTYPVGTNNAVNYTTTYSYLQGSSDLQSNTLLANNVVSGIRVDGHRVEWPAPGHTLGGAQKDIGYDRRKTRITVKLPANAVWDSTLEGNDKWTYNSATQTITKDVLVDSYYDYSSFSIKYNNQPVGTSSSTAVKVDFPITWQFINDDGTPDPASLMKSVSSAYYYSYPGTPPTDYGLSLYKSSTTGEILNLNNRDSSKHGYITHGYWNYYYGYPDQPPAYGTHKTIAKFIDTPVESLELISAHVFYQNTNSKMKDAANQIVDLATFDATQIANMAHNKLVGTLPDNSTEVIATDIPVTEGNYQDDQTNVFTLPVPKKYTRIELIFDTPIKLQSPGGTLGLKLNVKLAPDSYNTVINNLNANGSASTTNKGKLETTTGTAPSEVTGYQGYSREYASEWDYYHEAGSISPALSYYNQNITYSHNTYFTGKLGNPCKLENAKYMVLAPPELDYKGTAMSNYSWGSYPTGIPDHGSISTTYQTIYNYKGTGMTAYIHDLSDLYLPIANASNNIYSADFSSNFKTTRNTNAGNYTIRSVLYYDNNGAPSPRPVPGASADPLDVDNDGNTTEHFIYRSATAQYSPPLELILTKRSKRADSGNYSSVTTADSNQEVDYQLKIYNNSIQNVGGFTFLDILPYAGDKAIVPNDDGTYDDRGSTFGVKLTGPLDADSHYTYQYSTDTPVSGNIAANYAANWVNSVADWSQVKMIKITMNSGYTMASGQTDTLHFKVKMPDSSNLTAADKANNSFAGFVGNNVSGAFEAIANTVVPAKYSIKGKVYYDMNPSNGTYDTSDGDVAASGRTVKLYDAGNTEMGSTTTDTDGNYSFDGISAKGNYTIRITPSSGDTLSTVAVPSSSTVIGNDFVNEVFGGVNVFKYTIGLTPEANVRTANAALVATDSKLRVKYQDDNGAALVDNAGVTVADTLTTYTFMAPYNVTPPADPTNTGNYEYVGAHSTSKPLSGTLSPGENVVILVYKRKDAGNVTVHHYEQGTTTSVASDDNLPGAGKLGLQYTTNEKTIANFTLVAQPTNKNGTFTTGEQTVIYEYKRNDAGNIIVHHYEAGGTTQLAADENLPGAGKAGLTYATAPKNITNYEVVNATPTGHSGNYPNSGTTVVTYEYRRKAAGNITVHHYEQGTTTQLMPDIILNGSGKLGMPYNTAEHTIPNFTLVAQPTNKNGIFTTLNQTVTYFYKRNDVGDVLVHHYEAGGTTSVAPDVHLSGAGKSGLPYTTAPVTLADFTVVNAAPSGHSGIYPATGVTVVTYEYTRNNAGDVLVHHYEAGGTTQLAADENLPGAGKSGLTYTTAPKTIANYTVVNAAPAYHTGVYPASGTRVITYEYRRDDAGDVTVLYVDTDGNEIDARDVLSGTNNLGLPYTTTPKTITNFTLINSPANSSGVFTNSPQTVTYIYKRSDAGDVTVYHKSVYDNTDLTAPMVLSGAEKLGLPYTTNPETYADFEIHTVPGNANGTFVSGSQTVTYLYKRKNGGAVTVNYLDNHGNKIETSDTITGTENVGLPYTTSPKTVQYYDLTVNPGNANGLFTVNPITVDYIYRRQNAGTVTIEHIDENGNVPLETPEVLDGTEKMGLPYTSSFKSFENYDLITAPANATGVFTAGDQRVTYIYRRKDAGNVVVHYIDTAGLPLDTDEILDGTRSLGLPYNTTEKYIPGYHLIRTQGDAPSGIFVSRQIELSYVYMKDPSEVIIPSPPLPGVTIPPSVINPPSPKTHGSVNPTTPDMSNPIPKATPSRIVIPGDRNRDLVIRPGATPSVATYSNARGSGGSTTEKPQKLRTVNTASTKNTIATVEPFKKESSQSERKAETKKGTLGQAARKPLSVPKTTDKMDLRKYVLMLIISLTVTVSLVLKKKDK